MKFFDSSDRYEVEAEERERSHNALHVDDSPHCFLCGNRAHIIADVLIHGVVDCRQPWCSKLCALGAFDEESGVTLEIVAADVGAIRELMDEGECWCGMRETTVCDWCPQHGLSYMIPKDPLDRSLAATQPMPAMPDESETRQARRLREPFVAEVIASDPHVTREIPVLSDVTLGDCHAEALAEYDRIARVSADLDRRLATVPAPRPAREWSPEALRRLLADVAALTPDSLAVEGRRVR